MRNIVIALLSVLFGLLGLAEGGYVDDYHIRVFLFGQVAYFSEVAVDLNNGSCLSLDNNLIDGKVQSVLIGGHDIWDVYSRDDEWYCILYDNYDCEEGENKTIPVAGGANNLGTVGWDAKVHGLKCINDD